MDREQVPIETMFEAVSRPGSDEDGSISKDKYRVMAGR